MKSSHLLTLIGLSFFLLFSCQEKNQTLNLVPDKPSKSPDYFCTWNIQGYVSSFLSNQTQRQAMSEKNMFGKGPYQNWTNLYPRIREDVFFVMDDSWDIPLNENSMTDNPYLGLTKLDSSRFPSFTGNSLESLKQLVDKTEKLGWKGLGGWICAQEAMVSSEKDAVIYWTNRLKEAHAAGFDYWKVDWGSKSGNIEWRRMLTRLGREYAPNLWIEHAQNENYVAIGDVYRTYDVFNVVAQPATINRIARVLDRKPEKSARALINCEDEPYIAAALGCAIGIMRHSFNESLPDGTQDFVFPPVGRDIKKRLDEVVRGVKWHRIAEPFSIGGAYNIDTIFLEDHWVLEERETWCTWCEGHQAGDTLADQAPARISRGLSLPLVLDESRDRPFVLSSKYPNGAIAIATIGRGINHSYITKRVRVEQSIASLSGAIGVFGRYEMLKLVLPFEIEEGKYEVYAQDLIADKAINITKDVEFTRNKVSFSGELIDRIGLSASTPGDLSDPGLVIRFIEKK